MTSSETSTTADSVRCGLVLPALIGGLALVAVSRSLSAREAAFLLDCRAGGNGAGAALAIGRAWAAVAGALEEPARGMAMLCALIAVGAVAFTAARRGLGAGFAAMLVMAATPAFWLEGTGIGTSAPAMAAVAVLAAVLAAVGRVGPAAAGRCALLVAAAAPFALADGTPGEVPQSLGLLAWAHAGAVAAHVPVAVLAVVTALAAAAVRLAGDRRLAALDLALIAAAVAAPPVAAHFGLGAGDPPLTTAVLPGAALVLAGPSRAKAGATTLVLLVLAITSFAAVHDETTPGESTDPRETLDWMRDRVDVRAWALAVGPRRDVYAFYETSGHRTGHAWYTPTSPADLARVVESAARAKAPVVTILGVDAAVRAAFAKYYDPITVEGAPPDVTVLGWRSG